MEEATEPTGSIVEHVPARAALAGNPSDGYAGAVFAIPVDAYRATVTAQPTEAWSVSDDISGHREFDDDQALRQAIGDVAADQPHALLLASLGWFIEQSERTVPPLAIEVTSTIPVSVGLAGSSAIVIGVLRAVHRVTQSALPQRQQLARIALGVETHRLGITAGLQDRLVQTHRRPVLMRFDQPGEFGAKPAAGDDLGDLGDLGSVGSVEVVEPGTDFQLMVAHRSGLSEASQVVHGDLRSRHNDGDRLVQAAMGQLAAQAVTARRAFEAGDAAGLGESMNATYELRAQMIDLVPGHVEMVDVARDAGAAANYTGSGGAVVVLSADKEVAAAARQSLKRLGCEIVSVDVAGARPSVAGTPLD